MEPTALTDPEIVVRLEEIMPPVVRLLGGSVADFDSRAQTITMQFCARPEFCHSEVIVQGGILTGMLDAAMAYVVVGMGGVQQQIATLELKMSFISPGNPGPFVATGRVVHQGKSTVFMASELHQHDRLVATATATGKLITPRSW